MCIGLLESEWNMIPVWKYTMVCKICNGKSWTQKIGLLWGYSAISLVYCNYERNSRSPLLRIFHILLRVSRLFRPTIRGPGLYFVYVIHVTKLAPPRYFCRTFMNILAINVTKGIYSLLPSSPARSFYTTLNYLRNTLNNTPN